MKKLLLSALTLGLFCFATSSFSQELTLKIIETHKDGDVSVSFDDGEYENDSIDKLDDDDLDMGWEGEDLNIMTSFTRFQNVTIPQGENIVSAILTIYAHEDEEDEAKITVYGEATDNSEAFSETEALADRTFTTASVAWNCSDSWTMWQPYASPDLASIIQEIVDRPGWTSGNSLTLFMQGQDQGASLLDNARDFESFENIEDPDDDGDGLHHPERIPTLVITYGDVSSVNNLSNNKPYSIYPTQVENGILNIDFNSANMNEVVIYNMVGKAMLQLNVKSEANVLDVSALTSGVYMVTIKSNSESYQEKIIVK
ncbi:MAG: T9SS type A sorting domain-containing protein [Bacteroidales bacterium]|nr:T9SS type A sorting domain-containing protein [Bacteroidales bacterium]MBN2819481.1 T9SS type A sorting domain-containing protein [Bacteroidales bacterium]